ncbi:hypothetical protein E2C01_018321 [Portunus trituberculatus]|uniref:Uncharacterized protein n=1 Tax=Portunus trituberculatus TaxID=210409 RepID=A0A5B7DW50_PORTR|nr:hypothetical protein [Portunus trituberculatus]
MLAYVSARGRHTKVLIARSHSALATYVRSDKSSMKVWSSSSSSRFDS